MLQEKARVLWNKVVGPSYFRIGLSVGQPYLTAKPGQFVMLRPSAQVTPFLRRPFSIHRLIHTQSHTTGIEILYKVVGQGTRIISGYSEGDRVDILGPLGNGFWFSEDYQRIALVAGGIGVAPMLFLASYLCAQGVRPDQCDVYLGGRSAQDLLCREDFVRMGMQPRTTTDDGSSGDQCLVTHPLEQAMEKCKADIIYACGPLEMLKCVAGIAEKHKVPCQISIETIMACGMGACLGCVVEKKDDPDQYLHVCVDGPVFNAASLKI